MGSGPPRFGRLVALTVGVSNLYSRTQIARMFQGRLHVTSFLIVGTLLLVAAPKVHSQPNENLSAEEIVRRFDQAEDARDARLKKYTATRRYVLNNKRFHKVGEMLVQVTYRKGEAKSFEILANDSEKDVSGHVFEKLLAAEVEASKRNDGDPSRISIENYELKLLGTEMVDGHQCYVIGLRPKKKNKFLLNGKAWIEANEFALVKLEGRPAENLSFWVGKPFISQTFVKVGEFWLSAQNRSLSDTRLLGESELRIEYSGYRCNGGQGPRLAQNPLQVARHASKP